MVTLASKSGVWQRASYLELEGQQREPQAIGLLMSSVLARYSLVELAPCATVDAEDLSFQTTRADRCDTVPQR